jgi:predicted NAD-dependent protein-ADP-ribosyltransferase YbiA (DUF1768 family)
MKAILDGPSLILVPDNDDEALELAIWKSEHIDHVLLATSEEGEGLCLLDLGHQDHACNRPINVTSANPDESIRLIGNFAATPFVLDGRTYASVESFWQSLKFEDKFERRTIAEAEGPRARGLGDAKGYGESVVYEGRTIAVGTRDHWDLMRRACTAKFEQNENARDALLATGERPLTHRMRRDSRAIPGAIMADIWMEVRRKLAADGPASS